MTCASKDPSHCGSRLSSSASFGVGSYSLSLKAAPGPGIATNFYLFTHGRQNDKSTPWNEIDFEVLGKQISQKSTKIWTNYFVGKGIQSPQYIEVPFDASAAYHNYTIKIAGVTIEWIVDDTTYRVVDMSTHSDMLNTIASMQFQVLLSVWGRSKQEANWNALGVLDDNSNVFPIKAFFKDIRLPKGATHSHAVSMAGCPKKALAKYPMQCDLSTTRRHVRCCSLEGKGMSSSVYGCNRDKTYEEALNVCSLHNLRLCTSAEISSDSACGTGCGFDFQRVWVLDGCLQTAPSNNFVSLAGCPSGSQKHPQSCDVATMKMSVRCCSLAGGAVGMGTYGCNVLKTFQEAESICSSRNLRLCSASEIQEKVACRTGCGFDNHRVWTSTLCV